MKKYLSLIYLSLMVTTLSMFTSCWDGSEDDAYRKKVAGTWVRIDVSANDVVPTTSYSTLFNSVLFVYGNGTYETYSLAGNSYGYNDFSSYYNNTDELLKKKGWNVRTNGHWTLENKEIVLSEEYSYIQNKDGEEVCNKSNIVKKANVTFDKENMFFAYTYNSSTEGTAYAEENIHTHEVYIKVETNKSKF
ncbi:MAG: hypothetical protein IKQ72_12700 [Bacteroidaceae bacterium]|nr:hypothetical protein [Bacteroidaceae bacterium]